MQGRLRDARRDICPEGLATPYTDVQPYTVSSLLPHPCNHQHPPGSQLPSLPSLWRAQAGSLAVPSCRAPSPCACLPKSSAFPSFTYHPSEICLLSLLSVLSNLFYLSFWVYTLSHITFISEESANKHLGLKGGLLSCLSPQQKIQPN